MRIDAAFTDITIADPDVADISTHRPHALDPRQEDRHHPRSVYSEGKKLVGVFDIEVTYDVSRLAAEIGAFQRRQLKVSSVNGRIMLSGIAPDAVTVDKAMIIARQFGPTSINSVRVLRPQQVMLEVRFVEASRPASRELGVNGTALEEHARQYGLRGLANQLPVTQPKGIFSRESANARDRRPQYQAGDLPISPIVAAGVLGAATPYRVPARRARCGGLTIDVALKALEEQGLARSLAEPNLVALSGDTASFLAGGEFPIPVPERSAGDRRLQEIWRRPGLHADRAQAPG